MRRSWKLVRAVTLIRPKSGDMVRVVFLDHAENSRDAIKFEVIGRVFKVTPKAYLIKSWGYVNEIDQAKDNNEDNENWFAIVKRAIEEIKVLK